MIWSIAWRNIWRNKLRSLIVILAVTLGLFGTIFITALSNGMVEQKIDAAIQNEISHIQIHHPEFMLNNSLDYYIPEADEVLKQISSIEQVENVSSRIKLSAMASTAASGAGIIINGIDPETESTISEIDNSIINGGYFDKPSKSSRILISQKLAEKLKARVGSKIVITTQSTDDELTYGLFRVTGIYKTSNMMFDEPNVFIEKDAISELLSFNENNATEIAVLLKDTKYTDEITDQIAKMYPQDSVMSWKTLQPFLLGLSSMMDQFSYMLLVIILIAMAFGIINTMLMVILERTRELGVLMAVGMNRIRIFSMIMLETIFLSLVGTVVGIAISVSVVELTSSQGINFAAVAEGFESMGYSALVYPIVYTEFYFAITIMVIITAILSSVYPARKALRLNPAETTREDA